MIDCSSKGFSEASGDNPEDVAVSSLSHLAFGTGKRSGGYGAVQGNEVEVVDCITHKTGTKTHFTGVIEAEFESERLFYSPGHTQIILQRLEELRLLRSI